MKPKAKASPAPTGKKNYHSRLVLNENTEKVVDIDEVFSDSDRLLYKSTHAGFETLEYTFQEENLYDKLHNYHKDSEVNYWLIGGFIKWIQSKAKDQNRDRDFLKILRWLETRHYSYTPEGIDVHDFNGKEYQTIGLLFGRKPGEIHEV